MSEVECILRNLEAGENLSKLNLKKDKGSHRRCYVEKGVLKNSANFIGKYLFCVSFDKVAGLQTSNFIKKRLQHKCLKSAKILRTPILKNICKRLLLKR